MNPQWLEEELGRARKRRAQLPKWARPVADSSTTADLLAQIAATREADQRTRLTAALGRAK